MASAYRAIEEMGEHVRELEAEQRRLREFIADLAWSVEVDRREPDKLLCHVQRARRLLLDEELAAEASASTRNQEDR
jgi:hypothetical protein